MEEGIKKKESIDFVETIKTQFDLKPEEAALYSPLVLAYCVPGGHTF